MQSMALELDDKDKKVIGILLFYKKEVIFETNFCIVLTRD